MTEHDICIERQRTTEGRHPYDRVEWKKFDATIKDPHGNVHFEQKGVEFPATWTEDSVKIVASKYFYTFDSGRRERSLKELLDRVIDTITQAGRERGYFASEDEAMIFNHELKWLALNQCFAFNSPVWFNIGTPEKQQASACFINEVHDDMDSIMELAHDEANIFKHGSGAGVNLSPIRAKSEKLTGGGEASGPISFMRGYDAFSGAIKSGGKKRRAAKMIVLNDDHPDIEEFVECKAREEKKALDLIAAGHDASFDAEDGAYASIFFQNANHSVRVSDSFMHRVQEDKPWSLSWVKQDGVAKTLPAKELFRKIAKAAWECGDPGLQFDDTIHRMHTCKGTGRQVASNPCSEYLFLVNTACNLASINTLKYLDIHGNFNGEAFRHAVNLIIIAQDILVSHADYPSEKIDKETRKWRTLGLGYANMGACLMSMGLPYDSSEGRAFAAEVTSLMGAQAYLTSAQLAARLEPFDGYNQDDNAGYMQEVIDEHKEAAEGFVSSDYLWETAAELGRLHGYRNAQVTVLAPTGTISFMMGCATTGIEPTIALVSYKQLVGGGSMKMANPIVRRALSCLEYNGAEQDQIVAHIEEHGTIEGAPYIKDSHLPVFDCAIAPANGERSISGSGHILMMAAVQPFLSGAISKTCNLPNSATVEDIEEIYTLAWKTGVKAIAVYRDGCKSSQPVSTVESGGEIATPTLKPRTKLPDTRRSITHKFKVGGQKGYFNVGLYADGTPGELFVTISKQGSTIAGLMDSFATAISIALQYGAPLEDLVAKFKHVNFEPAGFTNNAEIRSASSIVDYIFQWLDNEFVLTPQGTARVAEPVSYDTPACLNCGNQTQRSGACYVCPACGETTGCG